MNHSVAPYIFFEAQPSTSYASFSCPYKRKQWECRSRNLRRPHTLRRSRRLTPMTWHPQPHPVITTHHPFTLPRTTTITITQLPTSPSPFLAHFPPLATSCSWEGRFTAARYLSCTQQFFFPVLQHPSDKGAGTFRGTCELHAWHNSTQSAYTVPGSGALIRKMQRFSKFSHFLNLFFRSVIFG